MRVESPPELTFRDPDREHESLLVAQHLAGGSEKERQEPEAHQASVGDFRAPVQRVEDSTRPDLESYKGEELNVQGRISSNASNYSYAIAEGMNRTFGVQVQGISLSQI